MSYILLVEQTAPETPSTGQVLLYPKTDGILYSKDDLGTERPVAGIPQLSKSVAYTTVLADANTHILHPTADNNPRTFTIDSNANVPYPIGTTLVFINQINTVTIAITSDTLTLLGAGTTGSRIIAANGALVALKIETTGWVCAGPGVT